MTCCLVFGGGLREEEKGKGSRGYFSFSLGIKTKMGNYR